MPTCPHCGKEVSEGIEHCSSCNERLKRGFAPQELGKYIRELESSTSQEKRANEEWSKVSLRKRVAIAVGVIALLAIVPFIVILGDQPSPATPVTIALEILGTPEGDTDSGVVSATYDGLKLVVQYQFYLPGLLAVEEEVSYELAPMFKEVFSETIAREVVVHVMGPLRDQYGNITWMRVLTLGITRNSFGKINWSDMTDTEFYEACDTYWESP